MANHATHGRAYELPSALEASVVMLLHYVRSGECLYSDNPWTYTRCRNKDEYGDPVVVGDCSSAGLDVYDCYDNTSFFSNFGLAALRRF
ncbi:MAG: hypothetical protein AAF400_02500 [Bacteroidota bacterium]